MTKAAERLYITQPTLSRQIAEPEDELGTPLFVRSNRKVTLKDVGVRRRGAQALSTELLILRRRNNVCGSRQPLFPRDLREQLQELSCARQNETFAKILFNIFPARPKTVTCHPELVEGSLWKVILFMSSRAQPRDLYERLSSLCHPERSRGISMGIPSPVSFRRRAKIYLACKG